MYRLRSDRAKPKLIICGEPTSALDPLVADGILKLLMDLHKIDGVTYLYITHDLVTVKAIAESIAVICQGQIVRYSSKSEVLTPPFDDCTDLLLASVPEMQIGWLESTSESPERVRLRTDALSRCADPSGAEVSW